MDFIESPAISRFPKATLEFWRKRAARRKTFPPAPSDQATYGPHGTWKQKQNQRSYVHARGQKCDCRYVPVRSLDERRTGVGNRQNKEHHERDRGVFWSGRSRIPPHHFLRFAPFHVMLCAPCQHVLDNAGQPFNSHIRTTLPQVNKLSFDPRHTLCLLISCHGMT